MLPTDGVVLRAYETLWTTLVAHVYASDEGGFLIRHVDKLGQDGDYFKQKAPTIDECKRLIEMRHGACTYVTPRKE